MMGPQVGIAGQLAVEHDSRHCTDRIRNRVTAGQVVVVAGFKAPAPAVMG